MSINVCFLKSNKNRLIEKKFCSRSRVDSKKLERVIALGNFDGMHLGHQTLFNKIKNATRQQTSTSTLAATVVAFYPHPRYVLAKESDIKLRFQKLITPLRTRIIKLNEFGIDELIVVRFSKLLATFSPNEFIEKIILPLNPRIIVVGEDWCFGKNRAGDVNTLVEFGKRFDFEVQVMSLKKTSDNEKKIGASEVRKLIESGEVSELKNLLGSTFKIYGKVIRGDGRGRKIGFPTANIHSVRQKYPANGVYASKILIDGKWYQSISNVGTRPTFKSTVSKVHLETHVFDFDQEIYGKYVEVSFEERIRDEMKFANVDELLAQIQSDIDQVKKTSTT